MLDLVQLLSFVTVQDCGSFSRAAERLKLGQSTVSQHLSRLEGHLGCRLLSRDTHHVALTPEGEALLPEARRMLALSDGLEARFRSDALRGRIRFGLSEDLANGVLPSILERFAQGNPGVDLELTVALSSDLFVQQSRGEIDLVLAKRGEGEGRGELVAREPLVWLARDPELLAHLRPLPVISFPPPSLTRRVALKALDAAGIPWRISCTCSSLSGLTAAARAGLGVLVQPRALRPDGVQELPDGWLPDLGVTEFVLVTHRGADPRISRALSDAIRGRALF